MSTGTLCVVTRPLSTMAGGRAWVHGSSAHGGGCAAVDRDPHAVAHRLMENIVMDVLAARRSIRNSF